MSGRRALCVFVMIALAAAGAFAEGYPKISMSVGGGPHREGRNHVGVLINFDAEAEIGYLVWDAMDLYVGLRTGVFAETVVTAYMAPVLEVYLPIVLGAEAYFLVPTALTRDLVWTCGVASCMYLYTDAVHLNPSDYQPSYWYTEVFVGARWYVVRGFHVEARLEGGTMLLFDNPPLFAGMRLSVGLDL